MMLEFRDVCNAPNVCWQRVPNRWTSHWKSTFSKLGVGQWNCMWKCICIEERSPCRRDDAAVAWTKTNTKTPSHTYQRSFPVCFVVPLHFLKDAPRSLELLGQIRARNGADETTELDLFVVLLMTILQPVDELAGDVRSLLLAAETRRDMQCSNNALRHNTTESSQVIHFQLWLKPSSSSSEKNL